MIVCFFDSLNTSLWWRLYHPNWCPVLLNHYNLDGIFVKAEKKLGSRITSKGGVNPRVLRHILDDGRFCEEEIAAEYYGGLLAGSRDADSKNDSCLPFLAKVRGMPTNQLRLHFAFYYEVLRLHQNRGVNLGHWHKSGSAGLLLSLPFIMELAPHDDPRDSWEQMVSAIVGLNSLNLISSNFSYGEPQDLQRAHPCAATTGAYVEPNLMGAELFLWAIGATNTNAHRFFEQDIKSLEKPFEIPAGCLPMSSLDDLESKAKGRANSANL